MVFLWGTLLCTFTYCTQQYDTGGIYYHTFLLRQPSLKKIKYPSQLLYANSWYLLILLDV